MAGNKPPRPRAYRGKNHETLGSDVLALYRALTLPELLLGADRALQIRALDPNAWYPVALLLDQLELLAESVGAPGLRKIGRTLFQLSHEARLKQVAHSAKDVVFGIDAMYRHANRGEGIGGWKVIRFDRRGAELEKTTPHHCALEEGILDAALRAVGVPARIEQPSCVRNGAEACRFLITPLSDDPRWGAA